MPTFGAFVLGREIGKSDTIPDWATKDLMDTIQKKGKGQQEVIVGAMCRGACPHTAFKAGGNEMAQLSVADKGVATTSEKYTIAHSNHVGLNTSPYNGRTCQCWSKMGSRQATVSHTEASMKVLRRPTQDTAATTILRLIKRLRGLYH